MPIRILPKYNSGNPEPDHSEPTENIFHRLNAKIKFDKENIKPVLGDLFPLYRHSCIIFISGKYVGRGYGVYKDRHEDYEKIGRILAKI